MEGSFDDEASLIYVGEWLAIRHVGHQILVASAGAGRTLLVVEAVRHVVGIDGRALHSDIQARRAD